MQTTNNAKFAFWYLLSLVALIFMALSTGQVIFQIINKYITDFSSGYAYTFSLETLKFAISSLIISIPLYFLTARQIERSLEAKELDKDAGVRRWLTYLILFASSVVIIVWLIITINNFLGGELAQKFLFKALTVIVIAGGVFSYYLYDIRRSEIKKKDQVVMICAIIGLVITIAALVVAFMINESPREARARRHDIEVLGHFSQIDATINSYFADKKQLPNSLDDLKDQIPYLNAAALKDPESGIPYQYHKNSDNEYELCATFKSDNTEPEHQTDYIYTDTWPHRIGEQCLKQTVTPMTGINEAPVKPAPLMTR